MDSESFGGQTAALIGDIRRRYGWTLVALVLLMVTVALLEGIGMALLLPLLGAIGVAGPNEGGALTGVLFSLLAALGVGGSAYRMAAMVLVVLAAQLLLYIAQQWWVSWLQRDYAAQWQKRLFDAFVRADWSFFAEQKLGNLTNVITQETFRLSGALLILAQLAAMVVAAVVYLALALSIAWQVTALIIALAAASSFAVRGIGRRNFQIGMRLGPLAADLNVLLTEYLGGVKLIKTTVTEAVAAARVDEVIDEMCVQHTWATFLPALVRTIFEFTGMAGLCFILVFGYQNLRIPAASMLVVIAVFVRLLPRLNVLQQNAHLLATYVPAYALAQQVLATAEAASERARYGTIDPQAAAPMSGPLTIRIARGGYRGVTVIHDVNLCLPERGLVGIVGESGAGKSTLVNCLLGLAQIGSGEVSFGGVHMSDVPLNVWRRQIGYVAQDTVLFHLSIRQNIAWGKPDATDQEIVRAAREALAHDFILEQPQGYLTVIGDQGARLSGGQRQRLSIARALLPGPRMLIMDEATNALDTASEAAVLETIDRLRHQVCVVMVAHRLNAARNADLIVVLDKGRVVETGSWSDLLAQPGGALARLAATAL